MIKKLLAYILPSKPHFHGGLHITPPRHKSMSTATPSREAALSSEYAISLNQRDGIPFICKTNIGERVLRGQLLAEPANGQDAPLHAPTSGIIRSIEERAEMHPSNRRVPHIIIDSDGKDESAPALTPLDPANTDAEILRQRIADCGIVGLGGAGFPTALKLGHPANTLVINAAECEPYITCDDLQLRECAPEIIQGAQITARILGAEHILFGIEDDKPEAIAALEQAAQHNADNRIRIQSVPTRYPSGNARQLFELLLGIRIPANAHASDYGVICHNSGTMKAVYDAVIRGLPLTERYTTISGEGIEHPQVLRIRTGTPVADLIAQCGGEKSKNRHIIGGPMMGYEIIANNTALQKTGNCLLLLPETSIETESPCIRCARCSDACPMELLPQQLLWYSQSEQHNRLKQYRLFDCIECGICAAVCPSAIPLVQYYRHSKGSIRAAEEKAQQAEHARARHEARTARLEREAEARKAQMEARRAKLQQQSTPESATNHNDQTNAVETAKARATARKAERLAAEQKNTPSPNTTTAAPHQLSANTDKNASIEAAKARAAARKAERLAAEQKGTPSSNTATAAPHQLPTDADKNATIEATKTRAAARKAERLAAEHKNTPSAAAPHQLPTDANKSTAIEAAKARAAARKAERLAAEQENTSSDTAAPHQLPTDANKSVAIEAAKARAAARKAERLAAEQ
ncbi:MAG: electron transport complex subunit RsxC, partial [Cardiobacteriaceae bacterium]|nr:electron transport complex subunit RsxC [Cardiobacteriaceae bacterium]